MAAQDYALLKVFFDQRAVVNISNISQRTNGGLVPIKVLNYGLVGWSKGAGDIVISGTMYIPPGGFEEPVQKWAAQGTEHTIQIGCGATDFAGVGRFTSSDVSQSVDAGSQVSFEFQCPPSVFE